MRKIDPRAKLTPEDYLHLFWFDKLPDNMEDEYLKFQPTESLINRYNEYVQRWERRFTDDPVHYEKPVDWDLDREKTAYFKEMLQAGHEFEVWVEKEFAKYGIDLGNYLDENGQYAGENEFGLEIKHDMKLAETGNIYIEYQERLRNTNDWVNSGILKEDNTKYWIIGSPAEYYIMKKSDLISIYNSLCFNPYGVPGCWFVKEKANQTSKGFTVDRAKSNEIAVATGIEQFIAHLQGRD